MPPNAAHQRHHAHAVPNTQPSLSNDKALESTVFFFFFLLRQLKYARWPVHQHGHCPPTIGRTVTCPPQKYRPKAFDRTQMSPTCQAGPSACVSHVMSHAYIHKMKIHIVDTPDHDIDGDATQ
jgi:hypothetical protein